MKQIITNDELIPGKYYWVTYVKGAKPIPQMVYSESSPIRLDALGDEVKYLGTNRMWCHKANSQVFPENQPSRYYSIVGPIPLPEES
jgi:hypothetical protein